MEKINLLAAWIGFLLGFVTGAALGIFFHSEDWLGGYGSWKRRMIRLGHISFHGLALINLAFVFTVSYLGLKENLVLPSVLFIIGAVTMPLCCFVCAFKPALTPSFAIPVTSLIVAAISVIYLGFIS